MDDSEVAFGELILARPDLVSWKTHNAINEIPNARISVDPTSPLLHQLALNDPVVLFAHERQAFSGSVVSARVEDGRLVVNISALPQLETLKISAAGTAHHSQLVRLLVLDAGAKVPDADDANEVCPAKTKSFDWDSLISGLAEAADFQSFLAILNDYVAPRRPSPQEHRVIEQIVRTVRSEIHKSGMSHARPAEIMRSHYEPAIPDFWALTWRFRTKPDPFEVVVPVTRVAIPADPVTVGLVELLGSELVADQPSLAGAGELQSDWKAEAYARTVVDALDMWTAKQVGLGRIRETIAAAGFVYAYSPWQQKLGEGKYHPYEYSRPAGPPGAMGNVVRIVNLRSKEWWLGPILGTPNPCDICSLTSSRGRLLSLSTTIDESNELLRHVKRAISWRYRGLLAEVPVDAFLYAWISLEMMFKRPHEGTTSLIRRLPFAIISVGEKPGPIRDEIQKRWAPLRGEIVHRAIQDHPEIEAALRRVNFFSDSAIAFALERAQQSPSFDDWLDHLDNLSRTRPA